MSNNTNTNTVSFKVGETVHVFETKGCRELKGGPSSSERLGGEYDDIEPSEDLKVVKKLGSTKAIVEREDGTQISMHINHINPKSDYYALRGQKSATAKPLAVRIADKAAEVARLESELKVLVSRQADAEETVAEAKESEVSDLAREEAAALFAAEA